MTTLHWRRSYLQRHEHKQRTMDARGWGWHISAEPPDAPLNAGESDPVEADAPMGCCVPSTAMDAGGLPIDLTRYCLASTALHLTHAIAWLESAIANDPQCADDYAPELEYLRTTQKHLEQEVAS